jgi:rubrerythrin
MHREDVMGARRRVEVDHGEGDAEAAEEAAAEGMSDKNEKFKRLASARVTKAIKTIRLIGNLSNRNNYEYTDEQVDKIISALNRELKDLKARFSPHDEDDEFTFKL